MGILALALAGVMVWGVVSSWEQRRSDHHQFSTFLGFGASAVGATATALVSFVANSRPHSMDPVVQGIVFIGGVTAVIGMVVAFFASFFTRGRRRVAILSSAVVLSFIYLGILVSHFGD